MSAEALANQDVQDQLTETLLAVLLQLVPHIGEAAHQEARQQRSWQAQQVRPLVIAQRLKACDACKDRWTAHPGRAAPAIALHYRGCSLRGQGAAM